MHLKEKGFTLLEVMLTIGILSLTLVLTIPALDRVAATCKLKAEAERMAGVMRSARQEAIVSGQPRSVIFYPDGRYRVRDQANNKHIDYRLDEDVKITGIPSFAKSWEQCGLSFNALGDPGGAGTVTLEGLSGKRIYVITNPVQARIRVSFQPPANWK